MEVQAPDAGFDGKDTAGVLNKDGKAAEDAGFEHTETFQAGFEKAAADADFEDKEDAGFEDKATFHEGFDNEDRAGFLDKGFEKAANAGFGGKETFTEVQGFYDAAADFEKDKAGDDDDGDDGGGIEGWEEGEEEGWEEGEEEETTTEEEEMDGDNHYPVGRDEVAIFAEAEAVLQQIEEVRAAARTRRASSTWAGRPHDVPDGQRHEPHWYRRSFSLEGLPTLD